MAVAVRAGDATEDLAAMSGAALLGCLTIPALPEHVSAARAFVAKLLEPGCPLADAAVLLTSEVVTNAVVHSNSRLGGTVTLVVTETGGGLRIQVTDAGSELTAPIVRAEAYSADGHGLQLVQSLADQWGYLREPAATTVWFWLCRAAAR